MPKNVLTTTQVTPSHASKVMLKTLQTRLQQYMNWKLSDVQKAEEPEMKLPEKHLLLPQWLRESLWFCVNHNKLWKVLKEMWVLDHLTCRLRNLYAGQVATVKIRHGTMEWVKIGKGVHQGCILSPCWFNLLQNIMQNVRLVEAQSKLPGETWVTLDMQKTLS